MKRLNGIRSGTLPQSQEELQELQENAESTLKAKYGERYRDSIIINMVDCSR